MRLICFFIKEKIDYFTNQVDSNDLSELVDVLLKPEMVIIPYKERIIELTDQQAKQVFEIIEQKIMEKANFENEPNGIAGMKILVQNKSSLRKELAEFISRLPKNKVGIWIVNGWENTIPRGCREYDIIEKYFEALKEEGNEIVQSALKTISK